MATQRFDIADMALLTEVQHLRIYPRAGSDGSMSATGSAGPGFDPRRDVNFRLQNFQLRG